MKLAQSLLWFGLVSLSAAIVCPPGGRNENCGRDIDEGCAKRPPKANGNYFKVVKDGGMCGCPACVEQIVAGGSCLFDVFDLTLPHAAQCERGTVCNPETRRCEQIGCDLLNRLCDEDSCYCVDKECGKISNYKVPLSESGSMNCRCARDQADYRATGLIGKLFICDERTGNYLKYTCIGSECACADEDGKWRENFPIVNIGKLKDLKCP